MYFNNQTDPKNEAQRGLIEAVLAYVIFCGISFLSRFVLSVFFLVVVSGILFPLIWTKRTQSWSSLGFTQKNLAQALLWGSGAALLFIVYMIVTTEEISFPTMLILQLAVGIPLWFLIVSPFQEFFFRGWIQPRFQEGTGKWSGLFLTSFCFALWHFFPPFEGTPTSALPVTSISGFLSTLTLGLLMGYVFQRTHNISAPWVAHALIGVAVVVLGSMSFIQYTPSNEELIFNTSIVRYILSLWASLNRLMPKS